MGWVAKHAEWKGGVEAEDTQDARDHSYWELLTCYLQVGATLGDCALYRRIGRALDDGSRAAVEAELAHFATLPRSLRRTVRGSDVELDWPLGGASAHGTDRYWMLLVLYLQVGVALGDCPLYRRMDVALESGDPARIEDELAHFESLPLPLKTSIREADLSTEPGPLRQEPREAPANSARNEPALRRPVWRQAQPLPRADSRGRRP